LAEKFHDKLKISPATIFPLFQYHLYLETAERFTLVKELFICY